MTRSSRPTPSGPRVKICGVTRVDDALAAVDLGAAAIGLVFWPGSPRRVGIDAARRIVEVLPPMIVPVGVFVNQGTDEIGDVVRQAGLGAVQLHGDETPAQALELRVPVIKSIGAFEGTPGSEALRWPSAITLLVDAADVVWRGGTGRKADWQAAADLAGRRRILLAGGISAENVGEALTVVRPWGI